MEVSDRRARAIEASSSEISGRGFFGKKEEQQTLGESNENAPAAAVGGAQEQDAEHPMKTRRGGAASAETRDPRRVLGCHK